MKVLFLMFAFPDMNKSFNMFTTIVEEFVANGHEVIVVAPSNDDTNVNKEKGIDVLRVKTLPLKNVPNYLKGISNVLLPYQFEKALRKHYPDLTFDLIIAPTPPITLVDLASKLKLKNKALFYLILRDIFPQNAVDLGFMNKKGLLHNYFRSKEKKLYQNADLIGCMSQANIDFVLRQNPVVNPAKLHELRNFQKLYKGFGNDHSDLKMKFNIEDKYVVVFGGNMGKAQQLENVLELASRCQEYPDVLFLLLGEGVQMRRLAETIETKNINNIRIQGTISKQEYQDLLSVCDVGLISLHKDFTIPNIPSKALDYWNVGLPILASIDAATDFGIILQETQSGLSSIAEDIDSLKKNFDLLYANPLLRKEYGANGRQYFEDSLTPEIAYSTIINNLNYSVK